ncbi:MAG: molybdenum cofactor guanylyltransferase [Planctomycetales bacterium]|jgi:molybdopterin-guanine dinucleotide biosynthesis protein A
MPQISIRNIGGVVLCGGHSTRMGQPKFSLPFGEEVLLQRVCRILSEVVSPIVVVAAVDQELPDLPDSVRIARDEYDSLGPLAGIATGLDALRDDADAAFVTSCDAPLLRPDFVKRLIELLGDHDVAAPTDGQYDHVLAAVYRTTLADHARRLLAEDQRRPLFLLDESNSLRVHVDDLRNADPNLDSLRNMNTPEDYEDVLKLAGLH